MLRAARAIGLEWPLPEKMDDAAIRWEHGLAKSMSRKGCRPDNSRCFFGRLMVEYFYGSG